MKRKFIQEEIIFIAIIKIKNIKSNLQTVINYGKNGDKTEHGILVSSVNCAVPTAYEEMSLTKKFFHKEGKVLGYHIIQSFNGNEVPPKIANEIGKELAEELWGDKFQAVICTHINKENVHNHIILNSVSYVDGKKFHNSKAEIAFLKDTSDRLCYKYGLDVLRTPNAEMQKEIRQKSIDYFNRTDENMKKVILDIDEAVKFAKKYSDFKLVLKSKGYTNIDDSGRYLSIKTPYFNRKVRINKVFGEKYSVDGIKEQIYYRKKEERPSVANFKHKYYKKIYTGPKLNTFLLNTSSLYRLYIHYLYKFKILPAKNEYVELSQEYYKQKRKTNMVFEELNFLSRHRFDIIEQIKEYKANIENKLPKLKGERETLWRKFHKSSSSEEKAIIKQRIDIVSDEINTLYGQRNACKRIIDRYSKIKEDYKNEFKEKEEIREYLLENNKKGKKQKEKGNN